MMRFSPSASGPGAASTAAQGRIGYLHNTRLHLGTHGYSQPAVARSSLLTIRPHLGHPHFIYTSRMHVLSSCLLAGCYVWLCASS
jgi:hypothetical protein